MAKKQLLTTGYYFNKYKELYRSTPQANMDIVAYYLELFTKSGKHLSPMITCGDDWKFPEDRHEMAKHINIISNLIDMDILFVTYGNWKNDWKSAYVLKDGEFSRSIGILK